MPVGNYLGGRRRFGYVVTAIRPDGRPSSFYAGTYNTLIEGFDDFFTKTVRKTVKVDDALRTKVEGPYYDAKAAAPAVRPGVYPSIAQAEQVVSMVGIRNVEAAYLKGKVELVGG